MERSGKRHRRSHGRVGLSCQGQQHQSSLGMDARRLPALTLSFRDGGNQGEHLALPSPRAALRHACPVVLEAMVGPLALFYLVLVTAGFRGALIAALAWSCLALGRRLKRGERVSTLLLLGTGLLIIRTTVSFVTGSAFLYFAQPTAGMVVISLVLVRFGGTSTAVYTAVRTRLLPNRPGTTLPAVYPPVLHPDFAPLGDSPHAQCRNCNLAPRVLFAPCIRPGTNGGYLEPYRTGDLLLNHAFRGCDAPRWGHGRVGPKTRA